MFRHEITSRFRYFIADGDFDEKLVIFIMRVYLNIFYLDVTNSRNKFLGAYSIVLFVKLGNNGKRKFLS